MLRPALLGALLVLAGPALADTLTTAGTSIPASANAGSSPYLNAYEEWGDGCGTVTVSLPFAGQWRATVNAAVKDLSAPPALLEVRIDQSPLPAGSTYSQLVGTRTQTDFAWPSVFLPAGSHQVGVCRMNTGGNTGKGNLLVRSVTLDSPGPSTLPAEPAGSRDAWLQPFSSYGPWNSAIGSGIVGGAAADPDVAQLRANTAGGVNAGDWSMPFYLPTGADASGKIVPSDNTYPQATFYTRLPAGLTPATPIQGGDHHLVVFSTDRKQMFSGYGCGAPDATNTVSCQQSHIASVCGLGIDGYDWGAGVLRAWELSAGAVKHALRFSLPTSMTKAGETWVSGLAYPAQRSDYQGPAGLYIGQILYGSFVYLPADVDVTTLGLTPGGLVLAHALQDYGAYQRDTGGSGGIIFYAETAAEGSPAIDQMRADLNTKIIPKLTIGRNLGPLTPQGGGTPRQPLLPGINRATCPGP